MTLWPDVGAVEQAWADLLVELDATSYAQGTDATALAESPVALTAARPALGRHLLFSVSIEGAVATRGGGGGSGPGYVSVDGDLAVVLWYRLRAGTQREDARRAAALAADILRLMLHPRVVDGCDLTPNVVFRPGRIQNEWLPVELRFVASFDLSI